MPELARGFHGSTGVATASAMTVPPAVRRILVADDQPDVRTALRLLLKGHGYQVDLAQSPAETLARMAAGDYHAVLMDLNYSRDTTSGREGLECLARLRALDPETPVVVMTAWGTLELAVEAMRRGASDFVLKPWSNPQLIETLARLPRPETALARGVQRRLCPRAGPLLRTIEYAGVCHEAGPVGGDLYDFIPVDGGMGVVVADACGKGVPAALLAAHLQGMVRSLCSRPIGSLVDLLIEINARFLESTAPQHYATVLFGLYDDTSRRLTYVNCGHVPGLLLRGDGSAARLPATAPPLGLFPEWSAEEAEQRLAPGDLLAIVTDGVTEAGPTDGRQFGGDRLLRALREHSRRPVDSVTRALVTAAVSFAGGPPEDDLTVVVARALP
jgi:sigma-B regulation protein RsbU (phosphoserine phosphatase)